MLALGRVVQVKSTSLVNLLDGGLVRGICTDMDGNCLHFALSRTSMRVT